VLLTLVEVVTDVVIEEDVERVVLVLVFVVLVEVVTDVFAEEDVDLVVLVVDALWVEPLVVDWRCIPRTSGTVPIVAVSCARRARDTSRMLTRVRLACNSAFQSCLLKLADKPCPFEQMCYGEPGKRRVTR